MHYRKRDIIQNPKMCILTDMIHAMPAQYLQQTIRIYHHPFLLHVHTL